MKVKVAFVLLLLVTVLGLAYFMIFPRTYHAILPVIFDANNMPLVEVDIEGESYWVEIDVNSPVPLAFDEAHFSKIAKRSGAAYLIPSLKIGPFILRDLAVSKARNNHLILWQDEDDPVSPSSGCLGRFFFRKYFILLDFPHKRMLISNDIAQLQREGFSFSDMVKIPLWCGRKLTLTIETDVGVQQVRLTTTSTVNILNRSFITDQASCARENGQPIFMSHKLVIGNTDFGSTTFYILPEETADGALGMDFLTQHAVCIDCVNKALYVKKS